MMTNRHSLAFPIYAQIIGDDLDVHVEIKGDQAYFDGLTKTIVVPAIDLSDEDLAKAAWGKLYHEGFHARYTDMELFMSLAGEPIRQRLLNVVEDPVIEHRGEQEFLAARHDLEAMNAYSVDRGHMDPDTEDAHPAGIFQNHVLLRLRAYFNKRPASRVNADKQEEVFRKVFPKGVVARVNALLDQVTPTITSTAGSLALVDELLKVLEDEDRKQQQTPPDPSQGSPRDDGAKAGDDGGNADDEGGNTDDEGGNTDDEGGNTDDEGGNADDEGGNTDDEVGNADDDGGNADDDGSNPDSPGSSGDSDPNGDGAGKSAMRQVLDALEDDLPEGPDAKLVSDMEQSARQGSGYRVAKPAPPTKGPRRLIANQCFRNAQVHSQAARRSLQRMVEGVTRQRPTLKDYGQRIDRNRMHRVRFGDSKVFRHVSPTRRRSAAVHVLLDASPSMNAILHTAVEATMALGVALEQIPGVSQAITRFPLDAYPDFDDDVQPLLRRGERIGANLDRFNVGTCGGTPLTDALWYVLAELLPQKEERKLLLVVTDGEPNCRHSARECLDVARKFGIENVGIGIASHAGEDLFDVWRTISDVAELGQALFEIMQESLVLAA